MRIPTHPVAEQLLSQAEAMNPGPWVSHSRAVAQAAYNIAAQLPEMNPENAYILGLLHDIGRAEGVFDMRHIIDVYRWMMKVGYEDCARICLTHSFQLKDARSMQQNWDGSPEDGVFIHRYIEQIIYDDYDLLIQLCDALALPEGFCLIEKRMIDVALRRGINDYTILKWKAIFQIQQGFERRLNQSIYHLLPGVVENTFGYF